MSSPAPDDSGRFRDWVAQRLGLRFEESQFDFLSGVLAQRATSRALPCASYVDELERSASEAELQALVGELTVPETYFFRHAEQYRAYGEVALPAAQRGRSAGQPIKVLSVGCASGEEPYSLLMWARDHGAWPVEVTALDINPQMLARAGRGLYTAWALRETSLELQQRWFRRVGSSYELDPDIRRAVRFQQMNLAREQPEFWTAQRFDIIFCRNVLMYFTLDTARAAVARLSQALVADGHLFLGHAETMRGWSSEYHLCHTHNTFYYRRKPPGIARDHALHEASTAAPVGFSAVSADPAPHAWQAAIRDSAERIHALSEAPARGHVPDLAPKRDGLRRGLPSLGTAIELLQKERFAEALALLDHLPGERARDSEVMLLRAALLLQGGQLADAEQLSEQLLEQDELNSGAHYLLGLCRESAGDLPSAIEHHQTAIHLDADFAMPQLHLGLMARRKGDWVRARSALGAALPLLKREAAARLLLFSGGFGREGLIGLCRAELQAAENRT